jgi:hypothetical protein
MITENLFQLLYRFRRKDRDRVLWADTICINQADIAERGSQVTMMRDIYKSAWRTLVWLGLSSLLDDLAFRTLDEICNSIHGHLTTLQERI